MGRNKIKRKIFDKIVVDGTGLVTLFDTGAWNSYITKDAVRKLGVAMQRLKRPYPTGLGGKRYMIEEDIVIEGAIHGLPLFLHLLVLDKLGKTSNGRDIDILFGLLAMEQWGVELDIKRKKLDLSQFTKEFIEFIHTTG